MRAGVISGCAAVLWVASVGLGGCAGEIVFEDIGNGGKEADGSGDSRGAVGRSGEDCTNGRDDDGDGAIDCADTDCDTRMRCVPPAPNTWSGPAVLFRGPGEAPACPASYPSSAYRGFALSYEPAVCEPCACTAPEFSCTAYQLTGYDDTNCQGSPVGDYFNTTECAPIAGHTRSFRTGPPLLTMNSDCVPLGGTLLGVPEPSWSEAAVCEPEAEPRAGGCAEGNTCLPLPENADFVQGICVWQAGDVDCPEGFEEKFLLSDSDDSFTDTRDCSACGCEFGGQCSAQTDVYTDAACAFLGVTITHTSGGCTTIPGDQTGAALLWSVGPVGGCTPTGGATGGVVPDSAPTTVCCLP